MRNPKGFALAAFVALCTPSPALGHGENTLAIFVYVPTLVPVAAIFVWIFASRADAVAKAVTGVVVLGATALLTIISLTCFGTLGTWAATSLCPLGSIQNWPLLLFAIQVTAPYILWSCCGWWARRTGRAPPKPLPPAW